MSENETPYAHGLSPIVQLGPAPISDEDLEKIVAFIDNGGSPYDVAEEFGPAAIFGIVKRASLMDKFIATLRHLEWSAMGRCPACDRTRIVGRRHADDCYLAKAIRCEF